MKIISSQLKMKNKIDTCPIHLKRAAKLVVNLIIPLASNSKINGVASPPSVANKIRFAVPAVKPYQPDKAPTIQKVAQMHISK